MEKSFDPGKIGRKITTKDMIMCALFTALIAVGAFIKVPVPVVPFTLQFLFTMLAGLIMGGRLGAISVGLYAVLGLVGLPIFAEGGGIWYRCRIRSRRISPGSHRLLLPPLPPALQRAAKLPRG